MSVGVNPQTEVERLLKLHRAVLIRTKRHLVWKFPTGQLFTQACTPSDVYAHNNQLRDLKRVLGLNGERGAAGERREQKHRPGRERQTTITPSANTAMLEALRKVGLTEDALNAKIATLTIELRAARQANHRKKRALTRIQDHCRDCWGCRISRWWVSFRARWRADD